MDSFLRYLMPRMALPVILLTGILCTGCSGPVETSLPDGTINTTDLKNTKGALGAYRATLAAFESGFLNAIISSGLLTDELRSTQVGASAGSIGATGDPIDARTLPEVINSSGEGLYSQLHTIRNQGSFAVSLLERYAPEQPSALRAELDAMRGYAEVLLADLYCSGVPLSTADVDGDFTVRPGSPTEVIYTHAIQLFDSAIVLGRDSTRILNFARVGKGRAWMALGQYDSAVAAVSTVSQGFQYTFTSIPDYQSPFDPAVISQGVTVADREGNTGLNYISSDDPRSRSVYITTNTYGVSLYAAEKYPLTGPYTVVVADWIEARLIIAEAALRRGNTTAWLDTLNVLRATLITPEGAPALASLTDPGTAATRLARMFDERAYWLFLTTHRQGDLRRRVRLDRVSSITLYPTGAYFGGTGRYGTDVTLPIPDGERKNPFFIGCIHRNA